MFSRNQCLRRKRSNSTVSVCAQLCLTLCDPMDSSAPGSSVLGIFLARILEWVVISSSRGSSRPMDQTGISCVSCTGEWILYHWATWEAQQYSLSPLHMKEFCSDSAFICFNISPSNEHPGLISFRMDWLDLLEVQGTLNILQHQSSKASTLQCSAFFIVQLSHPYMTTGKTIALIRRTFAGKGLFNMLSSFFIAVLPRSKHLLA